MRKKTKIKNATTRVKRANARTTKTVRKSRLRRIWEFICRPFRAVWRLICRFCKWVWSLICRLWAWICGIDLVGLINLVLLIAIIILFSMLIIDVLNYRKSPVIVSNDTPAISQTTSGDVIYRRPQTKALPIKRNVKTNAYESAPVRFGRHITNRTALRQTPRARNTIRGDVIIDGRGGVAAIRSGDYIHGNVYLQNMRKYTLPCGVRINGNLFLRDMTMLQFCGSFTVSGNIYVSPRSSFGPLPRNARIGGQIIL